MDDRQRQFFVHKFSYLLSESLLYAHAESGEFCQWIEMKLSGGTMVNYEANKLDFCFKFTFPDGEILKSSWYCYAASHV